jgi:DNA invertase Pin-like site-specific DNA recombinase
MPKSREVTRRPSRRLRCGIYTRKSSDEGLEQAFNSLDAQREACAAFVLSQKHEGWSVLPTLYDDGGYSGGTLDRPALQRLLAHIADGKVDVVVVYKIDRLTRSLFDFAKIVDAFDARGVSFVSITQQFNTTTSMGRLTLNVLLSFAQFEREVAGERIRDKIAASKKKGMWMGGLPPLGYEVRDRKLVANQEEASTLLHIYRRYVGLRSVRALKAELDAAGIRSKRRTYADGVCGGHKLSRGALYLMLQNRIYRGEITHKGDAYPGEHKAIVDEALWNKVQAVLAANRIDRATGAAAKYPSLLAGLAFDDSGERLTPTHAVKKGTRYRYYVSKSLITGTAKEHSQGRRIPAGNLEGLVIGRLRAFLADEGALLSAICNAEKNGAEQKRLIARGRQISGEFPTLTPDEIRSILLTLINRIDIRAEHVEIRVHQGWLHGLLQARSLEALLADRAPERRPVDILKLKVKARLQRVGREMKLVVHNAEDRAQADPGLLRIVARAHDFHERLAHDPNLTVPAIASQERLTIGYLSRLLRLPSLAPDIVAAIINGKHPPELSAKRLMRLALQLPTDWAEQRKLLGFRGE